MFGCVATENVQGQLFRPNAGSSSYQKTENGYIYQGKEYIRGRDLPPNPNCPCPMCRDLVAAYNAAKNGTLSQRIESASTKLISTPEEAIPRLIEVFEKDFLEKSNFRLCDPGCGDARILIYAAKTYGIRGVGIEINPETYILAKKNVKDAGLEGRIEIRLGDSRKFNYDKVDGIVMFLFPELISDLTKKFDMLQSGVKVVSYSHEIPIDGAVQSEDIFVWRKE